MFKMSLNLDKYKDSMVEAWSEVMDEKSPTNWAIFGYDGQTFDLKLVSKGDGGIEEMIDDFNSGKIMYGLCRVKLDDKNVEKIALINWQGEGAPLARKGTCANHVSNVKSFFKGVHVTINARTDEDVEPDLIIAAVAKSTSGSGLRMSSSMESDVAAPVGTCYKRVNPQEEINSKAKNDFWLKEEQEEDRRKKDEQSKLHKFSRNEVQLLRRESQDYFNENEDKHDDVFTTSNLISPTPPTTIPGKLNGTAVKTNGDYAHQAVSPTPPSSVSSSGRNSSFYPTSPNNDGRQSASPTPTFSNSFVASEKAAALKASLPRKTANENLVRQRVKSFDGNNLEQTQHQFNSSNSITTTNGRGHNGVVSYSRNGADASPEGESLSVLRRKQLFENGGASSNRNLVRKISVSDEIKQLQQESLKNSQVNNKSPEPPISNNRTPSPNQIQSATDNRNNVVSPVVRMKSPSPQPQQPQFQFQTKAVTSSQPIKAYNLPFHIGGTVTGKLAEQVNKNSESNGISSNLNTNSNSNSNHHYTVEQKKKVSKEQVEPTSIQPPIKFQDNHNNSYSNSNSNYVVEKQPEVQSVKSSSPLPVASDAGIVNSNEVPVLSDGHSTPTKSIEITSAMGLCARALYDYQAADDTEITFDPGELITHIERIDEGWWEGMGPAGLYGLFPANYVELLN